MIQYTSQSNILVDRDLEMAQLRAGVDQSISGHGRLFLLTGEPGIGKTRLADELASYADSRGMRVLWGRCEEGEDTPAFWPWIQILRGCVREGLTTESSRQIEAEIQNFDYRLPELPDSQLLSTTSFSDAAREHPARFRMFDWMANFLRSTARTQPLLLVVDDLHWSDEPTSSLLRFLARALRDAAVMTLVTCRDVEVRFRERMAGILRHLARECSHVPIRPLDERGVSEMIAGMSGRPPSASLVSAVHRATGGNPLFVREISTGLFVNQSCHGFGCRLCRFSRPGKHVGNGPQHDSGAFIVGLARHRANLEASRCFWRRVRPADPRGCLGSGIGGLARGAGRGRGRGYYSRSRRFSGPLSFRPWPGARPVVRRLPPDLPYPVASADSRSAGAAFTYQLRSASGRNRLPLFREPETRDGAAGFRLCSARRRPGA